MKNIFKTFKVSVVPGSVKRLQMDDPTYFGPLYKDYVSNSKLALLNPAQGGSPQKFLAGFKGSKSNAFSLGSAVHQLTLEHEEFTLSNTTKPSGKLGEVYDNYIKNLEQGFAEEKAIVIAALDANYYTSEIEKAKNNEGLPSRLKSAMVKIKEFQDNSKETHKDGKQIIYLSSDLYPKCVGCTKSLRSNQDIQNHINWEKSFCEDVIVCDIDVTFPVNLKDPEGEQVTERIKLKMKADNWTIDTEKKCFVLNDLKTTGKPVQYFMGYEVEEEGFMGEKTTIFKNGSFQNFHYSRQMAMYLWMLKLYINQEYGEGYTCSSNMLVVETVGAFNSAVFNVTNGMIKAGFEEFSELIKRAAYHQYKGYENILELEINEFIPNDLEL